MSLIPTPKGFEAFIRFRSQKHWDWKGAKPDIQLQLAFETKCQGATGQKFIFTDKYVSQVLQNIANGGVPRDKMMSTACRPPSNFANFLQPIGLLI